MVACIPPGAGHGGELLEPIERDVVRDDEHIVVGFLDDMLAAAEAAATTAETAESAASSTPGDEEREAAAASPAATAEIAQHYDDKYDREKIELRRKASSALSCGRSFRFRSVERSVEREVELAGESLRREEREQLDTAAVILLLEEGNRLSAHSSRVRICDEPFSAVPGEDETCPSTA